MHHHTTPAPDHLSPQVQRPRWRRDIVMWLALLGATAAGLVAAACMFTAIERLGAPATPAATLPNIELDARIEVSQMPGYRPPHYRPGLAIGGSFAASGGVENIAIYGDAPDGGYAAYFAGGDVQVMGKLFLGDHELIVVGDHLLVRKRSAAPGSAVPLANAPASRSRTDGPRRDPPDVRRRR